MKAAAKFAAGLICLASVLFVFCREGDEEKYSKGREYRRLMDELKGVFIDEVSMVYEIESNKAIDKFYDLSEEDKDKAIERLRETIENGRESLRSKPFRGGLLMEWIKAERKKTLKSPGD